LDVIFNKYCNQKVAIKTFDYDISLICDGFPRPSPRLRDGRSGAMGRVPGSLTLRFFSD
jgi:hypothetical protein